MLYTDWDKIWQSRLDEEQHEKVLYLFMEYTNMKPPGRDYSPTFYQCDEKPHSTMLHLARYIYASRIADAIRPYADKSILSYDTEDLLASLYDKIGGKPIPFNSELDSLFFTVQEKTGINFRVFKPASVAEPSC